MPGGTAPQLTESAPVAIAPEPCRPDIRACGERIVVAAQRHAVCLAERDTDVVGKLGADPHEFDYSRVAAAAGAR